MSKISIEDNDTVDRYLRNKLNEEELNEFEIRLLDDQSLLNHVQREEAMVGAIREHKHSLTSEEISFEPLAFLKWLGQPYSLLSSFALMLSAVVILQNQFADIRSTGESEFISIASRLRLETLREQSPQHVSSGAPPILVTIDPGPEITSSYDLLVINDDSGDVVFQGIVSADDQGWLQILINRELSGNHTVSVRVPRQTQTIVDYNVKFEN